MPVNRANQLLRSGLFASIVLHTFVGSSPAGTPSTEQETERPMFPKETFTLDAATSYIHGFGRRADIGAAGAGVNYFLWDNFSLGVELDGYGLIQPGDDAAAAGIELTLRHHLIQRDRWTFFADFGFGPIESTDDVPDAGTRFNFVTRTGVGATYQLDERLHLMLGTRYWHLSNARIEGRERNPSINGIEGYVGLIWQF